MSAFVVVIVLVCMVMLGSISMLRASPKQTALIKLREEAKLQGFQVRLVPRPLWAVSNFEKASSHPVRGMTASYSLVFVGSQFEPLQAKVVDGQLFVVEGDRRFHGLPFAQAGSEAIEMQDDHVILYWNESDDLSVEQIVHIKSALSQLVQTL